MHDNRVREIDRLASKALLAEGREMALFENDSARGDGRERGVRPRLQARVGASFGVRKGEVIDALGKRTEEYDVVIFDESALPSLRAMDERHVVRVESLVGTIEVKSELDERTLEQVDRSLDRLKQLTRFFSPGPALRMLATVEAATHVGAAPESLRVGGSVAKLCAGVSPIVEHMDVRPVFTSVFAYSGPAIDTAVGYLGRHSMLIDAICVLGRYTVFCKKPHPMSPPEYVIWGEGDDAWGAFANLIDVAVTRYAAARFWVTPAVARYYRPSADDPLASGRESER